MYGVNLDSWRELDVTQEVEFWMKEHHAHLLWSLGSQPLLMLVGYGRMKLVSRKWNLTGLGWNTKYQPEELSEGYILHWNGMRTSCDLHVTILARPHPFVSISY